MSSSKAVLRTHEWEKSSGSFDDLSETEDEFDEAHIKQSAATAFLDLLLDLYYQSKMTAEQFSVLCYHAGRAGIGHDISKYGYRPGAQSGAYSDNLEKVLGFKGDCQKRYILPVHGVQRGDAGRGPIELTTLPPHEVLQGQWENDPGMGEKLREAISKNELPEAYTQHELVRSSSELIMPIALYLDGVAYSESDTAVGVWVLDILNNTRFSIALVRKWMACKCGCRGHCTFFPLMCWLKWSMKCLAAGVFPHERHDSSPWIESDAWRKLRQGTRMAYKAALVWLKADWSEFCERLGYPTWESSSRPCFVRDATGPKRYSPTGFSVVTSSWRNHEDADYDLACARAEISVRLSEADHTKVRSLLFWDKRPDGSHGRALAQSVPHLGLLAGDRVEPTTTMPDIGSGFDKPKSFPVQVLFWRPGSQTICLRRCPLFCKELGITPTRTLALDQMHTLYLGVANVVARHILWDLLKSGIWNAGGQSEVERLQIAVLSLQGELMYWYSQRARQFPTEGLTRMTALTHKMLGTAAKPKLKAKAAESWGVMLFSRAMLEKYASRLGPQHARLAEAVGCIERVVSVMKAAGMNMTPAEIQEPLCMFRGRFPFGFGRYSRWGAVCLGSRSLSLGFCAGLCHASAFRLPAALRSDGLRRHLSGEK